VEAFLQTHQQLLEFSLDVTMVFLLISVAVGVAYLAYTAWRLKRAGVVIY
jgi:threonine/homoserine/homoserine lactone efflux protein